MIVRRLHLASESLRNCDYPICTYRDRLADLLDEAAAKLSEHHAVGAFDNVRIGDTCPICSAP